MKTFELRNVKVARFASQETTCFHATLYIDGKRAADVENAGHGGPNNARFDDREVERAFDAYCRSLPPEPSEYGPLPMDSDLFLSNLLETYEQDKRLKRLCKSRVVFRLKSGVPGEVMASKAPFHTGTRQRLVEEYGDDLAEIYNETFGQTPVEPPARRVPGSRS